MAEYIEREATMQELEALYTDGKIFNKDRPIINFVDVMDFIENQPAADAQEVRHGKWKKIKKQRICSNCGFMYYDNKSSFNFCPKCGAKMDKE